MRNDDKKKQKQQRLLSLIRRNVFENKRFRNFSSWGRRVGAQCNFIKPIKAFRTSADGNLKEKTFFRLDSNSVVMRTSLPSK